MAIRVRRGNTLRWYSRNGTIRLGSRTESRKEEPMNYIDIRPMDRYQSPTPIGSKRVATTYSASSQPVLDALVFPFFFSGGILALLERDFACGSNYDTIRAKFADILPSMGGSDPWIHASLRRLDGRPCKDHVYKMCPGAGYCDGNLNFATSPEDDEGYSRKKVGRIDRYRSSVHSFIHLTYPRRIYIFAIGILRGKVLCEEFG
ncbi:transcription factor cwo isoform X1 [Vespula squamosa]|uniref:Transcription factor cwo isoform X1 n=1 Tax=Vespula squamosa TaxID=30214 RepID=A0ABD2B0M9_VESSQ